MTVPTTLVSPTIKTTSSSEFVTLAAGCFWGVERVFRKYFKDKGLIDAKVGYANGALSTGHVTYEKVCTGATNFAEGVQLAYDPSVVSISDILDIFFRIHDPTTANAQGPDHGTQYRSAVFVHNPKDLEVAREIKEKYQKEWYPNHPIATEIELINVWYDGEDYHQAYLAKNPGGYECPTHFLRTKPKI